MCEASAAPSSSIWSRALLLTLWPCCAARQRARIRLPVQRRGFRTFVLAVERKDWLNVGRALLSLDYWRNSATTHPGYSWYLARQASHS